MILSRSLLDDFPSIDFTINGGISSYAEMKTLLDRESLSRSSDLMHSERLHRKVKGVMIGRMVMKNPYLLRHIDKCFYGVPTLDCHGGKSLRSMLITWSTSWLHTVMLTNTDER